jgi:hypothetical protein
MALQAGPGETVCTSIDCDDFIVAGPGRTLSTQQYSLQPADATGTIPNLRVSGAFLLRNLSPTTEFARLSGETKTTWKWFLRPLRLSLALLLPTSDCRGFTGMVVEAVTPSMLRCA